MTESIDRRYLPFKDEDGVLQETVGTWVFRYDNPQMVVKVKKNLKSYQFSSKDAVTDYLIKRRGQIEQIRSELQAAGGSPLLFPESTPVVHQRSDGHITFTDTQHYFKGGKRLGDVGKNILLYPQKTLSGLQAIFRANASLLRRGEYALDMVGSASPKETRVVGALKSMFPLFTSANIIIDDTNTPRFIDHGLIIPWGESLSMTVRAKLQRIGTYLGSKMLSRTMRDQ